MNAAIRELLCQKCGNEYPVWYCPNELWNTVQRDGEHFFCPTCFIVLAEQRGLAPTAWFLRQESRGTGDGRDNSMSEICSPMVFLREEMEHRGWSAASLAERMGFTLSRVEEMLDERRHMTIGDAMVLGKVFGTGWEYWLNLRTQYFDSIGYAPKSRRVQQICNRAAELAGMPRR